MNISTLRRSMSRRIGQMVTSQKPSSVVIEQLNVAHPGNTAQYVIQKNNSTFKEFILSYPRGAYTGMRTFERDSIVELTLHMKRIIQSLSSMTFPHPGEEIESNRVKQALSPLRDYNKLEAILVPLLKKGLSVYYDEVDTECHDEAKVSVMVTYSLEKESPILAAHFMKLPAVSLTKRVAVDVENKARQAPVIKDSQWVRDRETLEKFKSNEVNEVILKDDMGQLYEGISSNFVAVRRDSNNNPVLMCAPLDHILLGTILKLVMILCEKHNIKIEWTYPKLEDASAGKWEGCFITSTSRLLLPIETMYDHDVKIEFKEASGIIDFLRKEVSREIASTAYKVV
ncbi:aminotransferase [Pilobolus umbonatus]|nr:aminotransferase [Pilobolus umbonatus]